MNEEYLNAEFVGAVIVTHVRVRKMVEQLAITQLPRPVAVAVAHCALPTLLGMVAESGRMERKLVEAVLWFNGFRNKVAHGADPASFVGRMDSLHTVVPMAVRPWARQLRSAAAPEEVMRAFMHWLVAAVEEVQPPGD